MANHQSVHHRWYIFGITCEKDPKILQQKLRVLMIEECDLLNISDPEFARHLVTENGFVQIRLDTLKKMAKEYKKTDFTKDTDNVSL
jgi:hypothetical protein